MLQSVGGVNPLESHHGRGQPRLQGETGAARSCRRRGLTLSARAPLCSAQPARPLPWARENQSPRKWHPGIFARKPCCCVREEERVSGLSTAARCAAHGDSAALPRLPAACPGYGASHRSAENRTACRACAPAQVVGEK